MPNWMKNRIFLQGEDTYKKMLSIMKFDTYGDKLEFDVSKIVGVEEPNEIYIDAFETMIGNDGGMLEFITPKTNCFEVVKKMAKMFPDLLIIYQFAYDDVGVNTGQYIFQKGELQYEELFDDFSKQAYESYFDLWGEDELYEFDETIGTYKIKKN